MRLFVVSPAALAGSLQEYLLERLSTEISIADMAGRVELSRAQFLRHFKALAGTSPHQWVMAARVQKAKELIAESNLSLDEIAASCGFASRTHLATVFKRFVNLSPAVYRREIR
jgi:transcriptional regulator GlxA family with amidase domain